MDIKIVIGLEDRTVETTLDPKIQEMFPKWLAYHEPTKIYFCSTEKSRPYMIHSCLVTDTEGEEYQCCIPLALVNLILIEENLPAMRLNNYQGYFDEDLEKYNEDSGNNLTWNEVMIADNGEMLVDNNGWHKIGVYLGRDF